MGQAHPHDVRDLRCQVDHQLVFPLVPTGDDRAPLHRHRRLPVHAVVARHPDRRAAHRIDVAAGDGERDIDIVAPLLVHQSGRIATRGEGFDHGGERFQVRDRGGNEVLGLGPRRGGAGGDGLARVARLAARQRPVVGRLETRNVGHHADRLETRQVVGQIDGSGPRLRDIADPRVPQRAPQERDLQRARHRDVGDITPAPAQEPRILLARNARAYPEPGGRSRRHAVTPSRAPWVCAAGRAIRAASSPRR